MIGLECWDVIVGLDYIAAVKTNLTLIFIAFPIIETIANDITEYIATNNNEIWDNNNSSSIMNRKLSKSIMLFKIKINIIKDKTNR